jgi:S-adenosylmethionine-diacylglycerol 3-amino-3-carboxypropyl transferase
MQPVLEKGFSMSDQLSAALIRKAVTGTDEGEFARSNARFAQSFTRLVYNQIWEDPVVDMEAMDIKAEHRVIGICSAGCNALSYLTADPQEVHAVDLNFTHLALADIKRAVFKGAQSYSDITSFLVEAAGEPNRDLYKIKFAPHLTPQARAYWDGGGRKARFESFIEGFYDTGLLGLSLRMVDGLARLCGFRLSDALALDDADQQREWARKHIRPVFEGRIMAFVFSLRHPLYLLGIPPRQFQLLCDNQPERMASVLADRVEQLAGVAKSSDNYFMWQAFSRSYARGTNPALPPYLQAQNFETIRQRIDRLVLKHDTLTNVLMNAEASSYDRYVLLDAQDWMDQATLASLWAQISRTARPGARVVFRTAGSNPPFLEYGNTGAWSQWQRIDELSAQLHERDRSGIYGGLHVYALGG